MTLLLSGTNGLSDFDGSASTPAIRGTDTNTGIFFPASDTIAFAEGGAEVARFDSNGVFYVGPNQRAMLYQDGSGDAVIGGAAGGTLKMFSVGTERMRIDSSGNLLVGKSSNVVTTAGVNIFPTGDVYSVAAGSSSFDNMRFYRNGSASAVGTITTTSSATSYVTSSDYRLKENIAPMTGALATVQALKPVTYKWKTDGSDGQGFIAHELAEVVPDCVTGEKDAVDAEGNPQYQGIDTSFLVATLTAAIQEQQAIITELKTQLTDINLTLANANARIEALEQA
jgi:hypothetical protein